MPNRDEKKGGMSSVVDGIFFYDPTCVPRNTPFYQSLAQRSLHDMLVKGATEEVEFSVFSFFQKEIEALDDADDASWRSFIDNTLTRAFPSAFYPLRVGGMHYLQADMTAYISAAFIPVADEAPPIRYLRIERGTTAQANCL